MTLVDKKGLPIKVGARVFTRNKKQGFVISLHPSTKKVRVMFENNMVRKFPAAHLERA